MANFRPFHRRRWRDDERDSLMCGCWAHRRSTSISFFVACRYSSISNWFSTSPVRSMIFTAYTADVAFSTHFRTVLLTPLQAPPLSLAVPHYHSPPPPLSPTVLHYRSMSAIITHCPPASPTVPHYHPLSPIITQCPGSLLLNAHHYYSTPLIITHFPSLSLTVSHYHSLSPTVHQYHSLSLIFHHYNSLFLTVPDCPSFT